MARVAVGYVRCAPGEAEDAHLGQAAQERALETYARLKGLRLSEIFPDLEVEAGVPLEARDGGRKLVDHLRQAESRQTHILVLQLERLFSTASEALAFLQEEWLARDMVLHVLDLDGTTLDTSLPLGKFMLSVLASAQTMEVEAARERVRTSHKAKRAKAAGEKPLLGEKVVRGYIVPDPEELRAVDRIRELAGKGKSLRMIAETLDEEGVPTKRRARGWSKESIRLILKRIEGGEVRSLKRSDTPD